ncbi:hypothetical protein JCM8547_005366 [Rhodosporidiobolus lusitaniae]
METRVHYAFSNVDPSCPSCDFHLGCTVTLIVLASSSSLSSSCASSTAATTPEPPSPLSSPSYTPCDSADSLQEEHSAVFHGPVYELNDLDALFLSSPPSEPPFERSDSNQEHQLNNLPSKRFGIDEEQQYEDPVHLILSRGELRPNVKGVGALAVFRPPTLRSSLSQPIDPADPSSSSIAGEAAWMFQGKTDAKLLSAQGIHIWDANSSRPFLASRGLRKYEEGDLGPAYGFAMPDLSKQAVPPCASFLQFYVHTALPGEQTPRLSCAVYQRSADVGLGLHFDLVTYALLTHTVAHLTSTVPDQLVYDLGDAHVYLDHVEPLRKQLEENEPRGWAGVRWKRTREELENAGGFDAIEPGDWELSRYEHAGRIKLQLHP